MDLRDQLQTTLGTAYSLERELSGGGMSRVFVAEETSLGRKVVVKVLPPELVGDVSVERFKREIQVAARLQHAHIVPVLSAGETNGIPYYTMPLVEGESLRDRIGRLGMLSITEVVSILRDVARALSYAHDHGVIHRDIKPDNVLIAGGSSVVTDFGIAKAISASRTTSSNPTLTQFGTALGTPAYMAPEQAAADPHADHRVDIYSFGCLAFELLTGRPPFVARTPQKLLAAQMSDTPEPVRTLRPDTPPTLAALVHRCLEKDPDDRPAAARELSTVLDSVTSSGNTAAMPSILLGGRRSVRQALLLYVAAFAAVAIVVKAATIAVGLPGWAFPGALIVMALGLPVILFTAYAQHATRRVVTATPTYTPGGTPSIANTQGALATLAVRASPHLSWRRATLGGVWAVGIFAALVGLAMASRETGIGPFASLVSSGRMPNRARVLVTEFRVTNADTALGHALSAAAQTELQQSDVVQLVSPDLVAAALRRMQTDPTARVDRSLARNIAVREGIPVIVDGEITGLGANAGYLVALQLVTADSGLEIASARATAAGPNDLLRTVGALGRELREKIGESVRRIHATAPLEQVTTSSLEALQKYVDGVRANDIDANHTKSINLLREAVAIDSTFAMAWRKLGYVLLNQNAAVHARADSALEKAVRYGARLTPFERAVTLGTYYQRHSTRGDRAKAVAAFTASLDAGDSTYADNLGGLLSSRRDFTRAVEVAHALVRRQPDMAQGYLALGTNYTFLGDSRAADSAIAEGVRRILRRPVMLQQSILRAYDRGQLDSLVYRLDSVAKAGPAAQRTFSRNQLATVAVLRGRLREFLRLDGERGADTASMTPDQTLAVLLRRAWVEGRMMNRGAAIARSLDIVLPKSTLSQLPESDRSYIPVAMAYVDAGRPDRARALLEQRSHAVRDTGLLRVQEPALHQLLAEINLAERKGREALAEFRRSNRLPDGPSNACAACDAFDEARAFDVANMPDSAIVAYEQYLTIPTYGRLAQDYRRLPIALKRLGELYEAKGNTKKAVEYYGRFVALWANADPELKPLVDDVRRKLQRLSPG